MPHPPHLGIIPKIQYALNDVARVFLRINGFRINVPEERLAKTNARFGFTFHITMIPYFETNCTGSDRSPMRHTPSGAGARQAGLPYSTSGYMKSEGLKRWAKGLTCDPKSSKMACSSSLEKNFISPHSSLGLKSKFVTSN